MAGRCHGGEPRRHDGVAETMRRVVAHHPRVAIVIDVGNTALKVAHAAGGAPAEARRLSAASGQDQDSVRALLASVVPSGASPDPVVVVSVVPTWTASIVAAAAALGVTCLVADASSIPIEVRLPHPECVGADRLLAAWTARELYGAPLVVADMGTATTIDAVDASGAFRGGAILPGPGLAISALNQGTAQLPEVPIAAPARAIGRDTGEAIQVGAVLGHIEAISGLISRIVAELTLDDPGAGRPVVVLTGGHAAAPWATAIRDVDHVTPDLVLRGLAMLAERLATVPG